jgi:hypothetical protein
MALALALLLAAAAAVGSDPCTPPAPLRNARDQLSPPMGLLNRSGSEAGRMAAVAHWWSSVQEWRERCRASLGLNESVYTIPALEWTQSSFIQPQVHPWDNFFFDPLTREYTIGRYLDDLRLRYGGIDSVLVWPTFPQLGLDDRNQFDYIRSVPGGVEGLKTIVKGFHDEGVRVLLPYNPWVRPASPSFPLAVSAPLHRCSCDAVSACRGAGRVVWSVADDGRTRARGGSDAVTPRTSAAAVCNGGSS